MIATFEAWRDAVFDHPVAGPDATAWYFADDAFGFDPEDDPARALEWVGMLFSNAGRLREWFSTEQIGQGLWFVIDPSASSHLFALTNDTLPMKARIDAIKSIINLYRHVFEPACGQGREAKLLDGICAQFWAVAPFSPVGSAMVPNKQDQAFLAVLTEIAKLQNPVCQKSLAIACGFWQQAYPEVIKALQARKS